MYKLRYLYITPVKAMQLVGKVKRCLESLTKLLRMSPELVRCNSDFKIFSAKRLKSLSGTFRWLFH